MSSHIFSENKKNIKIKILYAAVLISTISINPLKTGDHLTVNSADPDQTLQNAVSDQGLHCLQIVQQFFFRNIYTI